MTFSSDAESMFSAIHLRYSSSWLYILYIFGNMNAFNAFNVYLILHFRYPRTVCKMQLQYSANNLRSSYKAFQKDRKMNKHIGTQSDNLTIITIFRNISHFMKNRIYLLSTASSSLWERLTSRSFILPLYVVIRSPSERYTLWESQKEQ